MLKFRQQQKSDPLARLDIFLNFRQKEDSGMGSCVGDCDRVRLARMIHAGNSKDNGNFTLRVESVESIMDEFPLKRLSVWSHIFDSCVNQTDSYLYQLT